MPAIHESADRALHETGQIAGDVRGVFAGEFHLSRKRQIIADQDLRARDDSGRERLVVRLAQAENPTVILIGFLALDFHQTEVAHPFVTQAATVMLSSFAQALSVRVNSSCGTSSASGSPSAGCSSRTVANASRSVAVSETQPSAVRSTLMVLSMGKPWDFWMSLPRPVSAGFNSAIGSVMGFMGAVFLSWCGDEAARTSLRTWGLFAPGYCGPRAAAVNNRLGESGVRESGRYRSGLI